MARSGLFGACAAVLASLGLACRPSRADPPREAPPPVLETPAPDPACSGCEREDGACVAWREDGDEAGRNFARRVACDARCCG